jgi:hypothetical protein
MRKVIAGAFVSLDGVMQAPGAPEEDPTGGFKHGGWTFPYFDETVGQASLTRKAARTTSLPGCSTKRPSTSPRLHRLR